ncbi:cytochrome b [Shewanella litorisediminis]|uniref:Cytochrome b n=1 Tax=Shewanella litorisediminis TaxID=1173586 RepID=A0ABX7G5Z6_9GAMM|nr:cytochrome b/b6 domain-containing protein [Shewanella litorisediminis]MCL2917567.1 cytochrome b/b6 domain-containing protein [Shewanella litorisediminis]QRH02694.1 cytochrome b [Shewanella litorisediminis]
MWRNRTSGYGWFAIGIHWTMAVLILGLFGLGLWMVELNYYSQWYRIAPFWHKGFGGVVFVLLLLRLMIRLRDPQPRALGAGAEVKLAKAVHLMLYLLPLALVISGYLISTADGRALALFDLIVIPALVSFPGQEDLAGQIHSVLAWLLIALVTAHALAAIKHHVIDKNATLIRILKPQKEL